MTLIRSILRPADGTTLLVPTSGMPASLTRAKYGRVVVNPYATAGWDNQHKANLQGHTTASDGEHTPAQYIDHYHGAGYTILSITDHSSQGGTPYPTWPWTDYDRDPTALGMLAVPGNEMSQTEEHSGAFWTLISGQAASTAIGLANVAAAGGTFMLFHPGRASTMTAAAIAGYARDYAPETLFGLEVYNQGNRYPNDRALWDAANVLLTDDGITLWGYSGDDTHVTAHLFRNYNFFLLPELTEAAMRAACISGASYFCYEPGGSGNALAPRITNIELSEQNSRITVASPDAGAIVWRSNAGQVGTGATLNVRHLPGTPLFVRAELTNASGRTYTQPFRLAVGDGP